MTQTFIQQNGAGLDSKKVFCVPDGSGYVYPIQRGECPAIWTGSFVETFGTRPREFYPPDLIIGSQLHEWTVSQVFGFNIGGSNIEYGEGNIYMLCHMVSAAFFANTSINHYYINCPSVPNLSYMKVTARWNWTGGYSPGYLGAQPRGTGGPIAFHSGNKRYTVNGQNVGPAFGDPLAFRITLVYDAPIPSGGGTLATYTTIVGAGGYNFAPTDLTLEVENIDATNNQIDVYMNGTNVISYLHNLGGIPTSGGFGFLQGSTTYGFTEIWQDSLITKVTCTT